MEDRKVLNFGEVLVWIQALQHDPWPGPGAVLGLSWFCGEKTNPKTTKQKTPTSPRPLPKL